MEKHAHTAVPRLALAALVALSLAMAGCEMMRSGEAPTTLTIVLVEYKGAEAGASAHRMAKELTDQKLPDVFVVDGSDYASVCVGRYHSWKDEKADLMLKRVRMIRDARGQFPFVGVLLMPVPEPLPPNPWPLEKAKGQFTLHIASWEAPGRMARAQAFAEQCRAAGYEAYVQHGPRLSMVTLGSYGTEIFDDPTKIDRPGMKPRIIDPRVKDLMENKFPRVRLEGEVVPIMKTAKGTTSIETQLIRIPGRASDLTTSIPIPRVLYRISLTLTSTATGLAEGRGRASGVAQSQDEIAPLVGVLVKQIADSLPPDQRSRIGLVGIQPADADAAKMKVDSVIQDAAAAAFGRVAPTKATVVDAKATQQILDGAGKAVAGVLRDPQTVRGTPGLDYILTGAVTTFAR